MKWNLEAELQARPKSPDGSPDAERMREIKEDLRWLTGKNPRTGEKEIEGALDKARAEFDEAMRVAARARLNPKVLMRRAFDVSPERQAVLKAAGGKDQVGGLLTELRGVQADHVVSLQQMTEMEGFSKLKPHERELLAVRQDNLIAMNASANSSKNYRPWRAWPQASDFYSWQTIEKMRGKEAELYTTIQNWIKERVAGRP
jgi:hypothetical protein